MSRHPAHQIERILCPIDFEEPIESANEFASMLAKNCDATLIYLNCGLPDIVFGKHQFDELKKEEAEILQQLQTIKPTVRGVKAQYEVEFGNVAERIVDFASANEVDMIVIGTHGRKGLGRMIMGSVAENVIRNSDCPVVAIKPDAYVPKTGDPETEEDE